MKRIPWTLIAVLVTAIVLLETCNPPPPTDEERSDMRGQTKGMPK